MTQTTFKKLGICKREGHHLSQKDEGLDLYPKQTPIDSKTVLTPGFPGGSDGKQSACNAGDLGLIPGSERSPREGNGYQLQYSCLENSMDRGA